jgi:hypothetical protein
MGGWRGKGGGGGEGIGGGRRGGESLGKGLDAAVRGAPVEDGDNDPWTHACGCNHALTHSLTHARSHARSLARAHARARTRTHCLTATDRRRQRQRQRRDINIDTARRVVTGKLARSLPTKTASKWARVRRRGRRQEGAGVHWEDYH